MFNLKELHDYISRNVKDTLYSKDIDMELDWMRKQQEPNSLVEASYLQYKAQIMHHSKLFHVFIELISFWGYCFFCIRPNDRVDHASRNQDICIFLPDESYMPVREGVLLLRETRGFYLDKDTKKMFFHDMKAYKHDYYFKLKLIVKSGMYGYLLEKYSPRRFYCESEYSFTSSYLTKLCREKNVLHCNVQHGEKLLNIGSSFFSFDEMYTWDERYISIYKQLRANVSKYIIFTPDFLIKDYSKWQEKYDYKYYLQNQYRDKMEEICILMKSMQEKGYKVAVRMHPRYPDSYIENKYKDLVEKDVSIEQSLGETRNIIAAFSMVLLQAEFAKKRAIVDDLTDEQLYNSAKRLGYIMLQKKPLLLSEVLNGNEV